MEKVIQPAAKGVKGYFAELEAKQWSESAGAMFADYESWYANRVTYEKLLQQMMPLERILIFSGDVHYSFSASIKYWRKRNGREQYDRAAVCQLCSSSLKNEDNKTNTLAGSSFPGSLEVGGWKKTGTEDIRAIKEQFVFLENLAGVVLGSQIWYENLDVLLNPPDWRYRVVAHSDERDKGERGAPEFSQLPTDSRLRAARDHYENWTWDGQRTVVGRDNLGVVSFSWDEGLQIVNHEIWYAPRKGSPPLPFTKHEINISVPGSGEPLPLEGFGGE